MLNKSGLVWLQVKGGLGSESWEEGVVGSGTGLLEALMPEKSFACKGLGIKQEDRAQECRLFLSQWHLSQWHTARK